MILNRMSRKFSSLAMINKIASNISIALDKKICGVPMIEIIAMRICCYVILAVIIVRILGD